MTAGIEDLAEDLIVPITALNTRLGQLKAEIVAKEKHKAALQSECEVVQRSLDDLSSQRIELQKAVNAEKAELIKIQKAKAEELAAYNETRNKIMRLVG